MTDREKRINKAIKECKKLYGVGTGYDGAHIFPRSLYPELADNVFNIVPLTRKAHIHFDTLDIAAKFKWLERRATDEFRGIFREQINDLAGYLAMSHPYHLTTLVLDLITNE